MRKITRAIAAITAAILAVTIAGCASFDRGWTDLKSELGGGLHRTIKVYTANGKVLAEYEGKIDIAAAEGGYVKFDFNGKRYIYYNCFIETIADI